VRMSLFRKILLGLGLLGVAAYFAGCENLNLGKKLNSKGVPADGLLGAKVTALEYAMDNLPEEDRRYLDEEYSVYGLVDDDAVNQRALVAMMKNRTPPVVDQSALYARSSNSQWFNGRPALKWTASAAKVPEQPMRAEVVVGWMHSQIINQFTTYVMEFDGEKWAVVDVKLLEEAESELAP